MKSVAVAMLAIASLGLSLSQATADTYNGSSRALWVMEFNFCGSDCPYPMPKTGATDRSGGDTADKLTELEAKITTWQPHVVLLDEVCLAQLEQLITDLSTTTWPMDAGPAVATSTTYDGAHPPHYVSNLPVGFAAVDHRRTTDTAIPRAGCDRATSTGARTFGNAVLAVAGTPMSNRLEIPINVDANNSPKGVQKGICVTLADEPYDTRVCLAHTSPDPLVMAPQQIAYFYDTLAKSYGDGYPEIFAGDLNVKPGNDSLDELYDDAHGGYGTFEEADQCDSGRPDHRLTCDENTKDNDGDGNTKLNKKIDFVFASQYFFSADPAASTVNHSPYSDHGIYLASLTQCSIFTTSGCPPD